MLNASHDSSAAVRLGALLALRRCQSPEVSEFLQDPDPAIVLEAARAINDAPVPSGMPELAALLAAATPNPASGGSGTPLDSSSETGLFTLRRSLNANFRLGTPANAAAVAAFCAKNGVPEALRVEALEMMAEWSEPPRRDKIVGLSRPPPRRDPRIAAEALRPFVPAFGHAEGKAVRIAFLRAAAALRLEGVDYLSIVSNALEPSEVRIEALKSLAATKDARLAEAIQIARADSNSKLRAEATRLRGRSPEDLAALAATLQTGSVAEKQSAIAAVSEMSGLAADDLILQQLESLLAGAQPKELALDTLEAAGQRNSPAIKAKLAEYEARLAKEDPLAPYRPALYGGKADEGRKVFFERQDAGCFRCHKIKGEGGAVGPDLTGPRTPPAARIHPRVHRLSRQTDRRMRLRERPGDPQERRHLAAGVVKRTRPTGELVLNLGGGRRDKNPGGPPSNPASAASPPCPKPWPPSSRNKTSATSSSSSLRPVSRGRRSSAASGGRIGDSPCNDCPSGCRSGAWKPAISQVSA